VYSLGRYQDPQDPDLLHEAHLVYRKESAPRWKMDAPPANKILVGPRITKNNPEAGPLQNKELEATLLALEKANRENRRLIEQLSASLQKRPSQEAPSKEAEPKALKASPAEDS
jgi:hypothetical protein